MAHTNLTDPMAHDSYKVYTSEFCENIPYAESLIVQIKFHADSNRPSSAVKELSRRLTGSASLSHDEGL
ncbi:hypothetical protein RRG08_040258 [Elysia crispata]|uniref:Uncharacterized protein n=1 Tax=Elysia crispata TaxID=231223 RepID=A0AAE0YBD8_9GAST|nr:hypothetical protein RRG08_040258 [Elysia crispata]